jgi:glutamine---fructose-6-phosphate transaminase (isomerizing)
MTMRSELAESPLVVGRLLESAQPRLAQLAAAARERGVDLVVVAARGTSDHAATYAQYVLGERNRLPVALAAPSLASLYGHGPRFGRALVVGISQSGRSPDVVGVVEDGRAQGALTLAITNDPASPLAEAAEVVVPLGAGPELAVAATKTYVAELVVVALLSEALAAAEGGSDVPAGSAQRPPDPSLAGLPAAIEAAIDLEPGIREIAHERAGMVRCAVLGRGYQYATVREWALKLKEVAGVAADAYSAADFEHGPISMVEPGFPILAVATTGPALAGMTELLGRLRGQGADLLVMSDVAAVRGLAPASVALPANVPEWLSPIVSIVPCQLFAYHFALASGHDPETPRNVHKVTLTR